jgi:hypothetical protein
MVNATTRWLTLTPSMVSRPDVCSKPLAAPLAKLKLPNCSLLKPLVTITSNGYVDLDYGPMI